jgi:hypothetical protein
VKRLACCLLVAGTLLAGCGSGDDGSTSTSEPKQVTTETTDTTTEAEPEPTKVPEPVPDGEVAPIVITTPRPFSTAVGTLLLAGQATVFEGALHWAILGSDLKPMVEGHMQASCGAPCRGRYRVRIPLAKVPLGSYELHVWAPDASGRTERQHDTMVPVTISDQQVEGAPEPGSVPPGGPPPG